MTVESKLIPNNLFPHNITDCHKQIENLHLLIQLMILSQGIVIIPDNFKEKYQHYAIRESYDESKAATIYTVLESPNNTKAED